MWLALLKNPLTKLVDYNYEIEKITEKTNLDGFEIVKH